MDISKARKLEIFFFPWIIARGHMIPMIDTARVFAAHGAKVTILTTPDLAQLFRKTIERDRLSLGRDIDFLTFQIPEGGGDDDNDVSSPIPIGLNRKLFLEKLQEPIEKLLLKRRPDCLVSDMFYPWTADLGARLGIPRVVFHVVGLFPLCCEDNIRRHTPHEKVDSDIAPFPLSGLPSHIIQFTRRTIPAWFNSKTGEGQIFETIAEAELKSYGVIFNSFYDLEGTYAEHYKKVMGAKRLWLVGPVYLFNQNYEDKAERGEKNSIDGATVLKWLDTKPPESVLYVSFGSQVRMAPEQFFELAQGLEASGHSFIWVARNMPENGKEKKGGGKGSCGRVLPEGFEERMIKSGKGLIVRNWAPQLLILEHPSVGGFITHCGWNSTVEGLCAGLPMITWPLSLEQFFTQSLLTDVLKTGIRVGNDEWMSVHSEPKMTVTREKVEKAVKRLLGGGGGEVEEMRRRAKELSEKANKAVGEGGSSDLDIVALINEFKSRQSTDLVNKD